LLLFTMELGDYRVEVIPDTEFRLDGGAMFGVVPRVLWERVSPPDDLNRITLTCNRLPDRLQIVVDDDGCGLPAEERTAVLGRFSRGSTAAPGGSGLGLALVTQQAALHGGRLELDDSPLGGLRATLTISERAPDQIT